MVMWWNPGEVGGSRRWDLAPGRIRGRAGGRAADAS